MAQPPLRRKDRKPRLEDDYYGPPDPYNPYDDRAAPPRYQDQPPRRHKSERRRPANDDPVEPRRRRHRSSGAPSSRFADPAIGVAAPRRGRSPPPHAPAPPRPEKRSSRHDHDALPSRDPYARDRGASRGYAEPDPRYQRPLRAATMPVSDPRREASRSSPQNGSRGRSRPGPRDYPPPAYYDDDHDRDPRRRPRSHGPRGYGGGYARNRSPSLSLSPPPRRRSRPPQTKSGRRNRGSSVPAEGAAAAGGAAAGAAAAKRASWWKNPLLQAGGRAAFTAGAQAAMRERKENGAWLGTKGAKVATAALGAALVDGFIGSSSHPNTNPVAHDGVGMVAETLGNNLYKRAGR